jgi:hypothetical protein
MWSDHALKTKRRSFIGVRVISAITSKSRPYFIFGGYSTFEGLVLWDHL